MVFLTVPSISLTPKLPLVKRSCNFFAVTRQNHYLCKIFVSQLLKSIVEGHAFLINPVYLTIS